MPSMEEMMQIRDLLLVVRRSIWLVVSIPILLMIVTLAVSLVEHKTYSSQAQVSLTASTQMAAPPSVNVLLLSNMPPVGGLAQAFMQQITSQASAKMLGIETPENVYDVRFDERKALLTMIAEGATPGEARERAEHLLRICQDYFQERIAGVTRETLNGAAALTKLDITAAEANLRDVQGLLQKGGKSVPPVTGETSAALEAFKVDPRVARSPNPAYAYLSLEEATLQAQLARSRARALTLGSLVDDHQALLQLSRQSFHVEVLASPAEPLKPTSPRPLRNTVLAGLVGSALGIFGAFAMAGLGPSSPQRK